MGRTACTEPQCLYKGDLYLFTFALQWVMIKIFFNKYHSYYTNTWWKQISLMISELLQILTIPVTIQSENFPRHTVSPATFFSLHIYTQCFSTFSGAWEYLSCRMLSCTRSFHDRYCVQWLSKSDSCSKAPILPSLFQNYLLHWSSHF